MRTYFGAAIACLTLMLTGIARADHFNGNDSQCDARNKSVFLDYQLCSDDLKNPPSNDNYSPDDNKGGKGGNYNNGGNDNGGGNICLPPIDNGGGCDKDHGHDSCGDTDCHHKHPCDPTDPHDPAVVPLPASSALGGCGLAALALMGWLRSRRAALA